MRALPPALPIDDVAVADVCDIISNLNRSERHQVHQHLLKVARTADDRIASDNRNVVACRLTQDERARLREWCRDHATSVSSFARDAVRDALRRETNSP